MGCGSRDALDGVERWGSKSFNNSRHQDTIDVTVLPAATELSHMPRRVRLLSVTLRTFGSSKGNVAVMGAGLEVLRPLGKEGSW
jgi:hypothetical protein